MDDKRTAFAVVLCLLVVMFYSEMFLKPPMEHLPSTQQAAGAQTSGSQIPTQAQGVVPAAATQGVPSSKISNTALQAQEVGAGVKAAPSIDELRAAGMIHVDSPLFHAKFSTLGARLLSFRLNEHKKSLHSEKGLELIHATLGGQYPLGIEVGPLADTHTNYTLKFASLPAGEDGFVVPESGDLTLVFEGSLGEGRTIEKSIRFTPNSYMFDVDVKLSEAVPGASTIALQWPESIEILRQGTSYDPFTFAILTAPDSLEHLPVIDLEGQSRSFQNVRWLGMGDKYFGVTLIGAKPALAEITQQGETFTPSLKVQDSLLANFKVLLGPKDYELLHSLGNDLHRTINLGFFALVSQPLIALLKMFYALVGNWGLAIVLLTLLVKLIFLPLNAVSFRSMKALQDLKPEMDALRARVKDPAQLNQEVMGLYKRKGVNPMGGCLPAVVQIPVFLGLYNGLLSTLELRHAPFALWITDLSAPEHLDILGIPVPVLILLMGASMFWAQVTTPTTMDPMQKRIMYAMPIIFTISFIIFPFPSGLVLYWLVNNLISIVQQTALRSSEGMAPLPATLLGSAIIFGVCFVLTLL